MGQPWIGTQDEEGKHPASDRESRIVIRRKRLGTSSPLACIRQK